MMGASVDREVAVTIRAISVRRWLSFGDKRKYVSEHVSATAPVRARSEHRPRPSVRNIAPPIVGRHGAPADQARTARHRTLGRVPNRILSWTTVGRSDLRSHVQQTRTTDAGPVKVDF